MLPVAWSFTTIPAVVDATIWSSSATPSVPTASDGQAIEVGVKFESAVAGYITGIRFYKGSDNTGTHVGHLWDAQGDLLATATFTDESDSGWQQVNFSSPVAIQANTTYVASYYSPNGTFAIDGGYFATSETVNGELRALSSPESGGNGVFVEGTSGFPTVTVNSANYWVDVVFSNVLGTTSPTVVSTSPAAAATNVSLDSSVTATFSEAVLPGTISFVLTDPLDNTIPATLSYDPVSQTATLTPNSPLAYGTTYTATLSGAQDLAGNAMTTATWTFTTVPDTTPPTVVSSTPIAGATGVPLGSTVTATFSEAVQESTISFVLTDQSNNTIPATWIYDPGTQTVTLTPTAPLAAGTTYTATLSGTQDLAANEMATVSWSFTADTPPTVLSTTPSDGSTNVALVTTVSATFSEPVVLGTINFVLTDSSGNVIAATLTFDSTTNTAILTPDAPLNENTTYTVTLSGGRRISPAPPWRRSRGRSPPRPRGCWDEKNEIEV